MSQEKQTQPNALQLEEAVLGALLLDQEAIISTAEILRPEMFYGPANEATYAAILSLYEAGHPIDVLTVQDKMKAAGTLERAGGASYLVGLTNRVTSAANVEYHARIIAQKYIQRRLISFGSETIRQANGETADVFDALEKAEIGLFNIWQGFGGQQAKTLQSAAIEAMRNAEAARTQSGLVGVPAGLTTIDRITGGWRPSDLIILAARPGMGKTALALNMAYNAAKDFGKAVAVFSLEMGRAQLAHRLISAAAGVDGSMINTGRATQAEFNAYTAAAMAMDGIPLYIDDTPGINIFELRAKCRRLKMRHDIQMVIIDYLQLMDGGGQKGQNREQEISTISRALKRMAKELAVPVIALSQLSRAVEARGNKQPQLSDLRESGAIEQDADIVSFIYRPEYYGILEDENGQSLKNVAEFIVAKNRNGHTGFTTIRFQDTLCKFSDLDAPEFQPATPIDYTIPANARPGHDQDIPF